MGIAVGVFIDYEIQLAYGNLARGLDGRCLCPSSSFK